MGRDQGLDEIHAKCLKRGEGAGLVLAHEAAVADHIGGQDGGKFAFHAVSPLTGD